MVVQKTFEQMKRYFDDMVLQRSSVGVLLWNEFLTLHPSDAAQFFSLLDLDEQKRLFDVLPFDNRAEIFIKLADHTKVRVLSFLPDKERGQLLSKLSIDELTDIFDDLSDDDLREYLKLLHKKDRQRVISLLQFDPESAGGIMETDVITLMQEFTIEKSVKLLQRLQPEKIFHQTIFITDQENHLEGHIKLEDLVLKNSKLRLSAIARKDDVVIFAEQDRQDVVDLMTHYDVSIAPVTDKEGLFLGVITSDTLVDVVEQEASEDIYRMATLAPMERSYFDTPFFKIFYQRGSILMFLLLAQSISSMILKRYEAMLCGFFTLFITMLTSTGGNASSQTSAIVIQGLASGQINDSNMGRFLLREFSMAGMIAGVLGIVAFARAYVAEHLFFKSLAVSMSLSLIVLASVILGSCIPIALKKVRLDPAHSAGPLLATLMDIVGITIYCVITSYMLRCIS